MNAGIGRYLGRVRLARWGVGGLVLGGMIAAGATGRALGQAQVRDFAEPFVALDTGGHHAPVRALIFPEDGRLLAGGFDKVVTSWSFRDGRPDHLGTVRPPSWRGMAGAIYALALAPVGDKGGGGRLLAIGGYGVENQKGNIALYRDPGAAARPTGDLVVQLKSGRPGDRPAKGHTDTVACLAFTPDGKFLISGGNDGRVLIWDVAARSVVGELPGHAKAVNAIDLTADGRLVATGGADGVLRLFDLASRALVRSEPAPRLRGKLDPDGDVILSLDIDPTARRVAVGRENGVLTLHFLTTLALERRLMPDADPTKGPIEALTFNRDGTRLATSIVQKRLARLSDPPMVACDIEVWDVPAAANRVRIDTTTNLCYALAFSPDDSRLAYAGGDAQAIVLADWRDPARPRIVLKGGGASVWDVGFAREGLAVGFARRPEDRTYEGFDLITRAIREFSRDDLARAVPTFDGWTVRPVDPYTLDLRNARGRGFRLALDRNYDRRWWSYSFIPPGPGHPQPTLAVGCEAGIAFYGLDGRRTRLYAGHAGPVYAVAPSPDGRWLVTGSSDQTVRLWPLAGCDRNAPLGARFERGDDGRFRVADVERLGFADAMGLEKGDVILRFGLGDQEESSFEPFLTKLDKVPPGERDKVILLVRRGDREVGVNTSRRDSPMLSLFAGIDGEWVLWMPRGYYETSADGDRRYLVWHRNGPTIDDPTDVFPAQKFERELRQPAVIATLLAQADLAAALAAAPNPALDPPALVQAEGPPTVRLLAPQGIAPDSTLVVNAPAVTVRAAVAAGGDSPVASIRLQLDGRPVGAPVAFNPPVAVAEQDLQAPLTPGWHHLNIIATNSAGKERVAGFDLDYPAPPPAPPRLAVLAIGVPGPFPSAEVPPVRFADRDATALATFFATEGRARFGLVDDPTVLTGEDAASASIRDAIAALGAFPFHPGDGLIVVLETHVFSLDGARILLGTDSGAGLPPEPSASADDLADVLASVAATGCRVMLLVDGVHQKVPEGWDHRLDDWVRSLYRRGVIAFVASNHGPSREVLPRARRSFALGLLEAISSRARVLPSVSSDLPLSLDDYQATVVELVQESTDRRQRPFCYIPETLSPRMPWLVAAPDPGPEVENTR